MQTEHRDKLKWAPCTTLAMPIHCQRKYIRGMNSLRRPRYIIMTKRLMANLKLISI